MSIQPIEPMPSFHTLAMMLRDRIEDYLATVAERDTRWDNRDGSGPDLTDLDNKLLDHAWGIHWLAAEIGKATP